MSTTFLVFTSILIVSSASLVGVLLLSFQENFLRKALMYFVSFAVGALFANVFFHLLPEVVEQATDVHIAMQLVLLGIIISFIIEKFIHWHHCHNLGCKQVRPFGVMMLVGDGVHNVLDGMLIAAAYFVDTQVGIATTIAIVLHEIPQEIGDFAVLLHSGLSKYKALAWNFLSALTAFIGGATVIALQGILPNIANILLPIVAGNFLYIAGSDLIPELHKESEHKKAFFQLLAMLAGIGLMYLLTVGDVHA